MHQCNKSIKNPQKKLTGVGIEVVIKYKDKGCIQYLIATPTTHTHYMWHFKKAKKRNLKKLLAKMFPK